MVANPVSIHAAQDIAETKTHEIHTTNTVSATTAQLPTLATQSSSFTAATMPLSPIALLIRDGAHSSTAESSASISKACEMTRTTRQPSGRAAKPRRRATKGDWSTKGCCERDEPRQLA